MDKHINISLISFGIAKDIIGARTSTINVAPGSSIFELKKELVQQFPEFAQLTELNFAVDESYQDDDYQLIDRDEVVILPPVSGG